MLQTILQDEFDDQLFQRGLLVAQLTGYSGYSLDNLFCSSSNTTSAFASPTCCSNSLSGFLSGACSMQDVHMLVCNNGAERSPREWDALLYAAGFKVARIVSTRSPFSIIEAIPQ